MNCDDFENIVAELVREQTTETSVRVESLAHRDECEACARRLEDESALSFRLRALAAEMRLAKEPALEDRLRIAFRDHQSAISRTAIPNQWRYWTAAAAAIVLVVTLVAAIRYRPATPAALAPPSTPGLPSTAPVGTSETTTTADRPGIIVNARPPVSSFRNAAPADRRTMKDAGRNTGKKTNTVVASAESTSGPNSKYIAATETAAIVTTNPSTTEITTDFIPVGYTTATNLQDGGQIVRMQLPRAALVALGLPVNMNRYNEKVKADVFFGADGMARAIRFVQ